SVISCRYHADNVTKCGGGAAYSPPAALRPFFGSDFNGDNGQAINYYATQDGNLPKDPLLTSPSSEI
ncbi:TPA: hypothetical protein MCU40_001601, partial [Klebsiella pneumoniae]